MTKQQKDAKRKEQIEKLDTATRALMNEEGFRAWIRTRNAFHTYSLNNQLLIACQPVLVGDDEVAEYATRVAGFNTWKNELDRRVVKGAKGLKIFAPLKGKAKDDNGNVILDENGRPKMVVYGFRLVSVFDVSQTEGAPLPEAPEAQSIAGENHGAALEGLKALAEELGYEVSFRDLSERSESGWCDPRAAQIVVDASLSVDEQVRILTHELCHAQGVGYAEFGRERAEVIVEAATTVALSSIGFDTSGESLGYIAGWGADGDLDALRSDLGKISEIAERIEEAVAQAASREEVAA